MRQPHHGALANPARIGSRHDRGAWSCGGDQAGSRAAATNNAQPLNGPLDVVVDGVFGEALEASDLFGRVMLAHEPQIPALAFREKRDTVAIVVR